MQCQVCKQDEASVHLTQIVDDDVRSLDLCVGCAKQKGVSDPLGFSFADVFKEAAPEEGAAGEAEPDKPARATRAEVQCSRCGLGHADFKKTGRLGCSDCYEAFAGVLDGMLKGMHKGIRHTGKVAQGGRAARSGAHRPRDAPGRNGARPRRHEGPGVGSAVGPVGRGGGPRGLRGGGPVAGSDSGHPACLSNGPAPQRGQAMKILDQLATVSEVSHRTGPRDRIVLSSRVRLARNLPHLPFPGHAKRGDRLKAFEQLMPIVHGLDPLSGGLAEPIEKLTALDKQLLVERHLISREHAAKGVGSGFVLNREESLCVMVNEEDHLRMQALRTGLQLAEAWAAIDAIDTSLQGRVELAFSRQYGFLTACPTNLGTGIRVSAMLHLPGLVLAEQVSQIIQAVGKLGLAVRGLYGEGTEALGNLFQVSNQMTLG